MICKSTFKHHATNRTSMKPIFLLWYVFMDGHYTTQRHLYAGGQTKKVLFFTLKHTSNILVA